MNTPVSVSAMKGKKVIETFESITAAAGWVKTLLNINTSSKEAIAASISSTSLGRESGSIDRTRHEAYGFAWKRN